MSSQESFVILRSPSLVVLITDMTVPSLHLFVEDHVSEICVYAGEMISPKTLLNWMLGWGLGWPEAK